MHLAVFLEVAILGALAGVLAAVALHMRFPCRAPRPTLPMPEEPFGASNLEPIGSAPSPNVPVVDVVPEESRDIEQKCETCADWQTPIDSHPCWGCLHDTDVRVCWTPSALYLRCQEAEDALEWLRTHGIYIWQDGIRYFAVKGAQVERPQDTFLRLLREAVKSDA